MEIIYDAESEPKPGGGSFYVNDPVAEREGSRKYKPGGLELMVVDEEYKRDPETLSKAVRRFLDELRIYFQNQEGEFVTYQEVLDYARKRVKFVAADYAHHSHPVITQWMDMLWKAGLIQKYRRGLWYGAVSGKITGKNFGITYWIWESHE